MNNVARQDNSIHFLALALGHTAEARNMSGLRGNGDAPHTHTPSESTGASALRRSTSFVPAGLLQGWLPAQDKSCCSPGHVAS